MQYRKYNPKKDKEAVHQIWYDCGWIQQGYPDPMDILIEKARTIVADVNGHPECLVVSYFGDIRHFDEELKFSAIAGVTTSLLARKQKLAAGLTAAKLAEDVRDGALVSGLGMFEQGYYDKLGFGTGQYDHILTFSPASLNVTVSPRVPLRLGFQDWKRIHKARQNRRRRHGSVNMHIPESTRWEMVKDKSSFGLGYTDDNGTLTHLVWISGRGKERGPFWIPCMVYQNFEQFHELMALLKSFGEQIITIRIIEPPDVQFQDLLDRPIRHRNITYKGDEENRNLAVAWWQIRICDLTGCLKKTHFEGNEVKFNLELYDPIEKYLDTGSTWRGISGDYSIVLGPKSSAKKGLTRGLPTLKTTVNAFSRLWLGCRSAAALTATDNFIAPAKLITGLDALIKTPAPHVDWPF